MSYPVLGRSGAGLTFRGLESAIGTGATIGIQSDTGRELSYPILGRSGSAVVLLGVEWAMGGGIITGTGIWLTTGIAGAVGDAGICRGTLVV